MHHVLCSTGALVGRPNGRDFTLLPGCMEKLRCDGFEFMMYDSWYDRAEDIIALLRKASVPIPVVHCEKHIGELLAKNEPGDWKKAMEQFTVNCQIANELGAKSMVLHLWNGEISDRMIENNLAAYPFLKAAAQKQHVDLMIENVVCNQKEPMTHWRALLEKDENAAFTFDTKMAAFHGQLEEIYTLENRFLWDRGHIRHLHINDYGGGFMDWSNLRTLHMGRGKIDFDRFFEWIRLVKYTGDFTVEATAFDAQGAIHLDELNETLTRLRAYLASRRIQ